MTYKAIVLDLDGTLYNLKDVINMVYHMQVDYLMEWRKSTRDETERFLRSNSISNTITRESRSATELFNRIGINLRAWTEYRNKHFDPSQINPVTCINNELLKRYSHIAKLFLLTSNTSCIANRILENIHIERSCFVEVICADHEPDTEGFNKLKKIKYISKEYECVLPHEMLSIGDRFLTDIIPMLKFGGDGVLIQSPTALVQIIEDLEEKRLGQSDTYEFISHIEYKRSSI